MTIKRRSLIPFLLLSIFMLAGAGTALAVNRVIYVEGVTVTLSSLNTPTLDNTDEIIVRTGGTLWVDSDGTITPAVTIKKLTIGDASTVGKVLFSQNASTLTVTTDIVFGASASNQLDMGYLVSTVPHLLRVGGSFLAQGNGSFNAGSGNIEYYSSGANQSITAVVGGNIVQYKNLTLSGLPSTGKAVKTFDANLTVQGTLTIKEKAQPAGNPVTYGSLAALVYAGGANAHTATPYEWPAGSSTAPLNVPITINSGSAVTLDDNKFLGAVGQNTLSISSGCTLVDAGKTITIQGNVFNSGGILGAGLLKLAGTTAQKIDGAGNYGNVQVANAAGVTLPSAAPGGSLPTIVGRLTIAAGSGKVTIPVSHHVSLLTFGGVDKKNPTYNATTDSTVFAGTGSILVDTKPAAVVAATGTSPTITYGAATVTIAGTVKPPGGPPDFAVYGNNAVNGEFVTVTIQSTPPIVGTPTLNNGGFSTTLNTAGLNAGVYTIKIEYPGGDNLAAATLNNALAPGLTVNVKPVTVTPRASSKTFGLVDPALQFDVTSGGLVGTDTWVGALGRQVGENVGQYDIIQDGLNTSEPANYAITVTAGVKFSIIKMPVTVTFKDKTKVYGDADAVFDYTWAPDWVPPYGSTVKDVPTITGTRDGANTVAGENVGTYAIKKSTSSNDGNYNIAYVNGTLTINRKPVSITFAAQTKTYGQADLTNSWTWTTTPALVTIPAQSQDAFTGVPSRDQMNTAAGEQVANSPFIIRRGTMSLGSKEANYNLTFTETGKLTIGKKDVDVAALTIPNKVYGANIPALIQYTGFIAPQTAPSTANTITWGTSKGQAIACSIPDTYTFTVNNDGSDPNYTIKAASPSAGSVTVTPAAMVIQAENKTKVANNAVFDKSGFSVTYNTLVCSDTATIGSGAHDAFTSGALDYTGDGVTAKAAGVYEVRPTGLNSAKYAIQNSPGWLVITADPSSNNVVGNLQFDSGGSMTWLINQADLALGAGKNPGWNLTKVNGTLIINASLTAKFRIDMVTMAGNQAGRMAKFDPTRAYSWEFIRANDISGWTGGNQFDLNYNGLYLFGNPQFGGQFSVTKVGTSLYLNYTPVGASGTKIAGDLVPAPVANSYTVANVLTDVTTHDSPALYLQPSTLTPTPQTPVTINLNVANLANNNLTIIGVDAYINFDSRFFSIASPSDVSAGGGVWDTVVYKMWNVGGDLDTVLAVNLNNTVGTSADGTVAKIKLTPTKTATGSSRVVFRQETQNTVENTGKAVTDLVKLDSTTAAPARVMTDAIVITVDQNGPVVNINNSTVTQVQPHQASAVNVKNGTAAARTEVVRTSAGISTSTVSGPVLFAIDASDAGVGLAGAPTLILTNGTASVTVANTDPAGTTVGPFHYSWTVPANAANGTWYAIVIAKDTIQADESLGITGPNVNALTNAFTLAVNTKEITGVVELESFKGTNRIVNFVTGTGTGTRTYDINLSFTSGLLLKAGAFQNRSALADRVSNPDPETDPLSVWLRYGSIANLQTLATKLSAQPDNVTKFIHTKLYGYITALKPMADALYVPSRSVDVYINGRLSPGTLVALGDYEKNPNSASAASALTTGFLNDFNGIVLGASIWEPVRFASVQLSAETLNLLAEENPDTVALNRSLLHDAYPQYVAGAMPPEIAQSLIQYGGGYDAVLEGNLLTGFDMLATDAALWPTPTAGYGPSLYNETVFLGIQLSSATLALLNAEPFPTGNVLTLLNQSLLQDAFANLYYKAPLAPATVAATSDSSSTAFYDGMMNNLNAVITSGVSIYWADTNRFAPWVGAIQTGSELDLLLNNPSPTTAQLIRENRLLLELGYDAELSKSVLATYRLVGVPTGTTQVSAKTTWNLREGMNGTLSGTLDAVADFVSDGTPRWAATDHFLRGGDINDDNVINLGDYNVLRANYGSTTGPAADVNGDGKVDSNDYNLIRKTDNWARTGDGAVN